MASQSQAGAGGMTGSQFESTSRYCAWLDEQSQTASEAAAAAARVSLAGPASSSSAATGGPPSGGTQVVRLQVAEVIAAPIIVVVDDEEAPPPKRRSTGTPRSLSRTGGATRHHPITIATIAIAIPISIRKFDRPLRGLVVAVPKNERVSGLIGVSAESQQNHS